MATWPTTPTWTEPAGINSGNEYAAADGLTATDMNAIVKNIIYLKNNGGGGGGGGYTLPQATATTLGGIKAATRDSLADTVEAKIDPSSGKLYVAPPAQAAYTTYGIVKLSATGTVASANKVPIGLDSNRNICAKLTAATTSVYGGFKATNNSGDDGATKYVNVNSNGQAYVVVPVPTGNVGYCHTIEMTKEIAFGGVPSAIVHLFYQYYANAGAAAQYYSSMPARAIFIGGYYRGSYADVPASRYIVSEQRDFSSRSNNQTVYFCYINTQSDTYGHDSLTLNDSSWTFTDTVS